MSINIGQGLSVTTLNALSVQTLGGSLGNEVGKMLGQLQGNMGQLSKMLGQMSKHFGKAAQSLGTTPQFRAKPQAFSGVQIDVKVFMNPLGNLSQPGRAAGKPVNFGTLPEAGGGPGSFAAQSQAMAQRITGSNKSNVVYGANGPWGGPNQREQVAVSWAMFKNPNVMYNADTKQFYTKSTDGSAKNVASLNEVLAQIDGAGGINPSNAAAMTAVGGFLAGRVSGGGAGTGSPLAGFDPSQYTGTIPSQQGAGAPGQVGGAAGFQQLMEMLEKLLQAFSGAQASATSGLGGGAGAASGAAAGSAAGEASGAGAASGAAAWPTP